MNGARTEDVRARVRMYRHGLGDCFLISLPRSQSGSYFILIDCGVILGTPNAGDRMTRVVEDVVTTTGGQIDLLVATHEHWDHLSGFVQAAAAFAQLEVEQVWLAWTEDPSDPLAQQLSGERAAAVAALRIGASRLLMAGDAEAAQGVAGLLEFFGAAQGPTTRHALEAVRGLAAQPRYCKPEDPPIEVPDVGARLYVLGPPQDLKLLKDAAPSKSHPETYALMLDAFNASVVPGLDVGAPESPFGSLYAIPNPVAESMDFFARSYWGGPTWRQIDTAWLDDTAALALQLDSATNNTSLVLAIELADGDVLLFAADAQVGNWLSWQDLQWTVGDHTVTGPDLLRRTVFYKVGHHGSHNATLREKGLEQMDRLQLAMIPVDHEMALKKRWGQMPLPALVTTLIEKTHGALLRSDAEAPVGLSPRVTATPLYFEVAL